MGCCGAAITGGGAGASTAACATAASGLVATGVKGAVGGAGIAGVCVGFWCAACTALAETASVPAETGALAGVTALNPCATSVGDRGVGRSVGKDAVGVADLMSEANGVAGSRPIGLAVPSGTPPWVGVI